MNDPVDKIAASSITKAKSLLPSKFSGTLVCGDFNFPGISWSSEAIDTNDTNEDSPANSFVDTLANSYLTQFVSNPTFQTDHNTSSNILDLVIADSSDRIDEITHYPSFSHQVLKWSYKVQAKDKTTETLKINTLMYNRGDYKSMNEYFDSIDWHLLFATMNAEDSYKSFLDHYRYAIEHVPSRVLSSIQIWSSKNY
jgi:hypothetical protein